MKCMNYTKEIVIQTIPPNTNVTITKMFRNGEPTTMLNRSDGGHSQQKSYSNKLIADSGTCVCFWE